MADETRKELNVDFNFGADNASQQIQIIVNALGNISKQIASIDSSVKKFFSNMRTEANNTANTINNAFSSISGNKKNKQLKSDPLSQANKNISNQQYKNDVVSSELNSSDYYGTREQKLILDYQRKQIDNQIKINNGLKQAKNETKNVGNETEKVEKKTKNVANSSTNWFKALSKIGLTVAGLKRVGQVIGDLVKESGSWIENLNLFEVTFGENYQETLDWSIEFAENLGFAVNEMVKFTGLFKQLSTSIGIADETGDKLAETLTSIGTDITSFYNLDSVQTAMEKLQAGIFSGQTKPLRSIGIDVTYQSIDNLLKTNEALAQFNTTSKKLDQSQKAIARTILVLQGAQNSFGDTQKTINSLSNQIRVFQGSLSNLKLALGDTFSEPFRKALIYVNGFIIALTDIIRMFVDLKTSTGNPLPDGTIIGQIGDELEDLEDSQGLLSFDKFNVAGGSGTGNTSITEALTNELNKQIELYDQIKNSMGDIQNEAVKIAESIKSWFVNLDDEGKFESFTDQAKGLLVVVSALAAIPIVFKIQEVIKQTENLTLGVKLLQKAFTPVGLIVSAIIGIIAYGYATNEEFRKSINALAQVLLELLGSILQPILSLLNVLQPVLNFVVQILSSLIKFVTQLISPIAQSASAILNFKNGILLLIPAIVLLANKIIKDLVGNAISKQFKSAFSDLNTEITKTPSKLQNLWKSLDTTKAKVAGLAVGVGLLVYQIANLALNWNNMSSAEKVVGVLGAIAAAAFVAATAIVGLQSAWTLGIGIAAIGLATTAGILAMKRNMDDAKSYGTTIGMFADGGIPRVGSLFVAGESGAEFVTNMSNGQTGVTNIQQFRTAMLGALLDYNELVARNGNNKMEVDINVNPREMARVINPYIKQENLRGGNK